MGNNVMTLHWCTRPCVEFYYEFYYLIRLSVVCHHDLQNTTPRLFARFHWSSLSCHPGDAMHPIWDASESDFPTGNSRAKVMQCDDVLRKKSHCHYKVAHTGSMRRQLWPNLNQRHSLLYATLHWHHVDVITTNTCTVAKSWCPPSSAAGHGPAWSWRKFLLVFLL